MPRHPISSLPTAIRFIGVAALLASGGIHLDLYVTGYHAIPTIGPLFLVQTISALALGLVLAISADRFLTASGALLAAGTLGGYVVSRAVGMFGFHEVATTAGLSAGLLDTLALCTLGYVATATASPEGASQDHSEAGLTRQLRVRGDALLSSSTAHVALIVIGLAALVLTLVDGTGSSATTSPATTTASTGTASGTKSVSITIDNFAFAPAHLTVTPDERIVVHNEDPVAHTLTAVPGSTPFGKFDSGNVGPGQTKTISAPKSAGTYQYYCSIHNYMTGSITVQG